MTPMFCYLLITDCSCTCMHTLFL